jgi:phage gp29-like protein
MKHYSRADWMAYSEIYGMPWRWVEFTDAVVDADRATAKEMVENIGSDTAAALPEGVQLKTLEVSGTGETFQKQLEWADNTISILYLGQTLTTDIGDRGSFAAAKVHDNVRADLLLADIQSEARMIREQVIRPMCRLRFPGNDAPCPHFKRILFERRDVDSDRLNLEQIRAARELGLPLEVDEVYDRLGFTKPEGYEATTLGGTV